MKTKKKNEWEIKEKKNKGRKRDKMSEKETERRSQGEENMEW